jgi:aspartyl-tRNA(Asn)/glutamyl-tRNA(Gln) amidotransferase subunit B
MKKVKMESKLKIGLEIHGYLTTKEKLFCSCKNSHKEKEAIPNTFICPICTGQPGSKPMLPNNQAIKKLIQIGLMLNCKINTVPQTPLIWWRKHYSWPDLPKGYQNTISGTYANPVGIKGNFLGIGITEVHLEEDPAAWDPESGKIDYNRSGAPLVEIVTEPEFKSAEEVEKWLKEMILTMSYIKALDSDAGIKADVNVSYNGGERVEIKNMNSLAEIKKAIDYEEARQQKEKIKSRETRRWDPEKKQTVKMREKESHADYRFIKDPDLPIIEITKKEVEEIKKNLPESPVVKLEKLIKKYNIEEYYAKILIGNIDIIEFFEQIIEKTNPKLAVPWVTVELLGMLNYNKKQLHEVKILPKHFIELLKLIEDKKITELKAKDILRSWKDSSSEIKLDGFAAISNITEIEKIVDQIIAENQKAVEDYKAGQAQALNFLIGQVMKFTNKRADYQTSKNILQQRLK